MLEEIVIGCLFIGAVGFLASIFFKNMKSSSLCPKGCAGCSTIDFNKIEKEIKKNYVKETIKSI